MSLVLVKLFSYYKVLKYLIISLDTYNYIYINQISSLLLQALNNSKQLFIIDLIVKLYRSYYFREVANRFLYITQVLLGQYSSNYSIRGISLNLGQESRVIVYKQRDYSQELLELQKYYLIVISKSEDYIFIYKLIQQFSNMSIVFNKPSIEDIESQE